MIIRKAVPAAALGGVLVFANDDALAGLTKEGPFLRADLTGAATREDQLLLVQGWEDFISGLIADTDDNNDIAALSALKVSVGDLRNDIAREHYMRDAKAVPANDVEPIDAEAVVDDAGSHPTDTGEAVISDASQQHGADSDVNEENDHEQAEQPAEEQPRRRRR